jgi:hypothetical protein
VEEAFSPLRESLKHLIVISDKVGDLSLKGETYLTVCKHDAQSKEIERAKRRF